MPPAQSKDRIAPLRGEYGHPYRKELMNYDELYRKPVTGEVDLGRGRSAACRMLSPAEVVAVRRALPEPEPPIVRAPNGEPMTDGRGGVLRDEGGSAYLTARTRWVQRFRAVQLAVAMGYITRDGLGWDRSRLCDPAEGRQVLGQVQINKAFEDAENRRVLYARAVTADMLGGDDEAGALLTLDELHDAYESLNDKNFGELVAGSAEGNSGSAQGADAGAGLTHASTSPKDT